MLTLGKKKKNKKSLKRPTSHHKTPHLSLPWSNLDLQMFVPFLPLRVICLFECRISFSPLPLVVTSQGFLWCRARASHCSGVSLQIMSSRMCGLWELQHAAQWLWHRLNYSGMWDLPRPGSEPMSPAWQADSLSLSPQEPLSTS